MFIEELNQELSGRMLEIWKGSADMPAERQEQYRRLWRQQARYKQRITLPDIREGIAPKPVRNPGTPLGEQKPPYRLFLKHSLSPGDVLVMTAAIESLHIQFPGQYLVNVQTTCMDIWKNNPRIDHNVTGAGAEVITLEYPMIHWSDSSPMHFMYAFVEDLGRKINRANLKLHVNRPYLYLSERENVRPEDLGPYVLINAGTKQDFTCKGAGRKIYQEVVDAFKGKLTFIQVGESAHLHKPLDGVLNYIGQTSARELIRLAYHSECGIGPVTFLHHIYAALQKPYVCYIGGREAISWEGYPTAIMLGSHGKLTCCQKQACWKSRVVPLGDNDAKDKSLCELPVLSGDEMVPKCLEMIGSEPAIKAINDMIESGLVEHR
jgi:ADP-heptose:LPS heptosyltransferase